jgi:Glycosyltransferase family 87
VNDVIEDTRTGTGPRQRILRLFSAASGKMLKTEDRIFTEHNLQLYGFGVVVAYALALGWRIFEGQSVFLPDGRLRCVDFGWMWLSSKFVVTGNPGRIFDYSVFSAAQLVLFGPNNCDFLHPFYYPPTFLFMLFPLGFMPYLAAFAAWNLATLLCYLGTVYTILPRRAVLVAALTPFFVPVNIEFGHNGFITAALVGFSLVFLEKRPWLSGPFLGLLTYKPQIGVLFPLALLASRNWRAVASATVMSLILAMSAEIAFGYQGWPSFVDSLFSRNSIWSPDGKVVLNIQSIVGLLHWAGAGADISWTVHVAVAAAVGLAVYAIWAKPIPYSLKAAALGAASVTVTPYMLVYDLCVLSVAVAFLVKDGLTRGFLSGERTMIVICWIGLFLARTPIGPVICGAVLFAIARRVTAYCRDTLAVSPDALTGDTFPAAYQHE